MKIKAFLRNLAITPKLIISYLLLGMGSATLISFVFYRTTKEALITRTLDQLTSIKILKREWLESYFDAQERDMALFSVLYSTRSSFAEIDQAFDSYGVKDKRYIHADSVFGTSLRQFRLSRQFLNIWLINKKGEVIYTTVKNRFSGKNILQMPGIQPEFIESYQKGLVTITLKDVAYGEEEGKERHLVLTAPVLNEPKTEAVGVILLEINIEQINYILTQRTGMGNTGESYVVGDNNIMRSKSRFIDENMKPEIIVQTEATKQAFTTISDQGILTDYRGVSVLSSYTPLSVPGINWSLMSEIDLEEAMSPVYRLRNQILVFLLVIFVLIIVITIYLAGKISKPIKQLNSIIQDLSLGILPENKIYDDAKDEIGQIAQSINLLVDGIKKTSYFAADIGKGNLQSGFSPLSDQDTLGHSLLEMRAQLVKLSSIVEKQNKLKTRALIDGQENERRRISRELHDGVGQMLTALRFKIQELGGETESVSVVKGMLDDTIQEVRRVSINLMPSVLWDFGLEAALKILIKTLGLPIDLRYEQEPGIPEMNMETRICLYRITQESIQNIQKYAEADHISIILSHAKDQINLTIQDNGKGFDKENYKKENKTSNGLKNMKERAALLNGTVDIRSETGIGTTILVYIPC